jgi:RHS repeat-associated protein
MTPARPAHAKDGEGDDPAPSPSPSSAETPKPKSESRPKAETSIRDRPNEPASLEGRQVAVPGEGSEPARMKTREPVALEKDIASSASGVSPQALPTGADKTGVSSQAISVPSGAGKIQGMGESFSAQLSTGIATFNVPIALPASRGAAQPALALSYSSAGGQGVAGMGWSFGAAFIARQTDRGLPKYDDPDNGGAWHAEQDRFVFNGGQELVPICLVGDGGTCPGKLVHQQVGDSFVDEEMPCWASGWQYFRPRVEGSYQRFFWSPDHRTWRVQDKNGVTMELGLPLDGSNDDHGALEVDPDHTNHIFRWNLSREYDAHVEASQSTCEKRPLNVVVFRYAQFDGGGQSYLTDIFDTTPAANPTTVDVSAYAHHTYLYYEPRPDPSVSFRRGWRTATTRRLARIDVASQTFVADGSRRLVRRYFFDYASNFHVSLLSGVQVGGRCADNESGAPKEENDQIVPPTDCLRSAATTLPEMTFEYQHVAYDDNGKPKNGDLLGYEDFDSTVHTFASSPDHSVNEELTDLFDINSDGLPDVLVTAPGLYGNKHGVFFNGFGGKPDSFTQCTIGVAPGTLGATATDITLKNLNLSAQDLDGDGVIDLLHMPSFKQYAVYTPKGEGCEWMWQGREINTATGQNLKIDFGKDTLETKVMDVNGDGLVDVVYSGGTEFETFFSLGRYPKGDGQFGHAKWKGAASADIFNDPVTSCVPWDSTPVRFSDPDIKLADMNGDGLADIVRLRKGEIRYWPGRGNGFWGTGKLDDCPAGAPARARNIPMTESPQFSDIQGDSLRLDDVNGDGFDDLVQVRFDGVDIWLNVDGVSWTDRHIIAGTPATPGYASRVRLVDMNGSGTRDILWGDGLKYKYIDLAGGRRPGILNHIANGLGRTTDIEYTTSTAMMLAAEASGAPWNSKMPMAAHVVSRVVERDHLEIVGRQAGQYVTELTYRDPVYDGRQREFRGFRHSEGKRVGDENSPSSTVSTDYLLGECKDEDPNDDIDPCSPSNRWQDNGREALKGAPVLTELHDEDNVFLSSVHSTYRLRNLYEGLDGRHVRTVFQASNDTFLYDTGPFVPAPANTAGSTLVDVELEPSPRQVRTDTASVFRPRSPAPQTARLRVGETTSPGGPGVEIDYFGNHLLQTNSGCVEGCATSTRDEAITVHTEVSRPAGDLSGWLWRLTHTFATGDLHPGMIQNEKFFVYNNAGDFTLTKAVFTGGVALARHHENPQFVAGNDFSAGPSIASQNSPDPVTILDQNRDQFGNIAFQAGANAHCTEILYDPVYKQLPIQETMFTGRPSGACGLVELPSHAQYDRGIAAITSARDLHDEVTLADYDGFGRPIAITKPDPDRLGQPSPLPTIVLEYFLTTDAVARPYSVLHTRSQDGIGPGEPDYLDVWAYVDGLGRTILTLGEADPRPDADGADFIAVGLTEYDNKGAPRRKYEPFAYGHSGDEGKSSNDVALSFPLAQAPPAPYMRKRYDGFGRPLETYRLDGSLLMRTVYHALSTDLFDAADINPGPHEGTFATSLKDGHGRTASTIERIHASTGLELRKTSISYLPTGQPELIKRTRLGHSDSPVVRWMRYDSQGRRVLNVDPDASVGFNPSPDTDEGTLGAWRYAYDDAGDLVGVSDARGCGVDYQYEAGGRLIGEDYSPCLNTHVPYSRGDPQEGIGFEVLYQYDTVNTDDLPANLACNAATMLGRIASISDRASKTMSCYDGRGRTVAVAKRVAKPNPPQGLANRYAATWYARKTAFDAADRPTVQTTGAEVTELLGTQNSSEVRTHYSPRGGVSGVDGSYGLLVSKIRRDSDGLVRELERGDIAHTTTAYSYDERRRLRSVQSYRGVPPIWQHSTLPYDGETKFTSPNDATFQLLLQDQDVAYDDTDNPVEIRDWRIPEEWPNGARPVTRKMQYDDLNRLVQVDYQYSGGQDGWVDPFASEDGPVDPTRVRDTRRAAPSPHVRFDSRPLRQTFRYDWLGNTISTDDDEHGFYDRSLGDVTNGGSESGPYRLSAASNEASPGSRQGHLTTEYDAAGNLTKLALNRRGPCLPTTASCSQGFVYDWDEVGRLAQARRWDLSGVISTGNLPPPPAVSPTVDLTYSYDASDARVIKTSTVGTERRHTVYVFSSLELRRAQEVEDGSDYQRTPTTEVPFLFANGVRLGRVVYDDQPGVPTTDGRGLHVFLELPDRLGSTSIVFDKATGELVEASTYQPYGGPESDYRPARWDAFREDYRFTGKEEDVEIGLQFFGKRYLSPYLGRWASADPLAMHTPEKSDLNVYAYVHGSVFGAVDLQGLEADDAAKWSEFAKGFGQGSLQTFKETIVGFGELTKMDGGSGSNILATFAKTMPKEALDRLNEQKRIGQEIYIVYKKAGGGQAGMRAVAERLNPFWESGEHGRLARQAWEKGDYRTAGNETARQVFSIGKQLASLYAMTRVPVPEARSTLPEALPRAAPVSGVVSESASAEAVATRAQVAREFYQKGDTANWPSTRIESHLQGIDFTKEVTSDKITVGQRFIQYQEAGKSQGNYYAAEGTPQNRLGISGNREMHVYECIKEVDALKSTAADTSGITDPNVPSTAKGPGGGEQWFTKDKSAFKEVTQ